MDDYRYHLLRHRIRVFLYWAALAAVLLLVGVGGTLYIIERLRGPGSAASGLP